MDMANDRSEETTFKCPSCGEEMVIEPKEHSDEEHDEMGKKPAKKANAGTMPMSQLRSKIQPTTNPPGMTSPNLNSY